MDFMTTKVSSPTVCSYHSPTNTWGSLIPRPPNDVRETGNVATPGVPYIANQDVTEGTKADLYNYRQSISTISDVQGQMARSLV